MRQSNIKAAGIDTGKACLDIAMHGMSKRLNVTNDAAGHQTLAAWLKRLRVTRVGIEASGGYEKAVVRHLRGAGFTVLVFQPRQVRALAAFRLRRAKNDVLDAELIAACAAEAAEIREAPDERLAGLAENLTFIEQIEEDMVRLKTRREGHRSVRFTDWLRDDIRRLKAVRRDELKRLEQTLRNWPDLAQRLDLVLSVPAIGPRTALALIVRLPELGTLSREQAAALAGLAPFDDDSGKRHGQRHIAGGRARLRKSLYAAALPAAFQWNPALNRLYQRLIKDKKPHKLALVACSRKLVIYANTVVQRGTPWIPENA
jgi:transposase